MGLQDILDGHCVHCFIACRDDCHVASHHKDELFAFLNAQGGKICVLGLRGVFGTSLSDVATKDPAALELALKAGTAMCSLGSLNR
jgi:hypothetical protein